MHSPLRRPILYSSILHVVAIVFVSVIPGIRLPMNERPIKIMWVDIPKGASDEIALGIKKSEGLPKSTLEEQKKLFEPQQKSLEPQMKAPIVSAPKNPPQKLEEPTKQKATPKKLSPADRKIANALAMIDKQLAARTVVPEAAQIKESGEGYKYGTGTTPLKVAPSDPEYLKYQAMLRAKIIQEWVLPLRYVEESSLQRRCSLSVMINMDGEVVSTQWENPSGDPTFDSSAVRAVRKASPFPTPPDRLAWEAYNEGFLVEFDPRLKPQ